MYFVTGASGLLGSFICRRLLQEKKTFRALRRQNSDLSLLEDVKHLINWIDGDILDPLFLEEAFKGVTTIIHSAAIVSFHDSDSEALYKTNVEGTANVVNACLNQNVPHLVHISSVAALGRSKESQHIDEETKWENSEFNTTYAKTKYLAELEVWRGQEEGLKVLIINPSVILGPGDWNKSSAQIFKYVWKEKPYYPIGSLNFIDIRDVIDILFGLINKDIHSERFILNGGNVSYKDLLELVAKNFNKRKPSIRINGFILKTAVILEKCRALFTGTKPLITKETAQLGRKAFIYDNQKVTKTLNYRFRPIEETVAWTCQELMKKTAKL